MKCAIVIFGQLQDMRQENKIRHNLLEIIITTIVAVMCGCTDWEEVAEFGRGRQTILKSYLTLANGIPPHDTFRGVMGMVDPQQLWILLSNVDTRDIAVRRSDRDFISVDGKTVRGSEKPGLKPIHLVSAWSSNAGVTLAQLKKEEKSNETTAIPDLLDILTLAGSIVTVDAKGCQTAIAEKIIEKKADYVLACKENQPTLSTEVQEYFSYSDAHPRDKLAERIIEREKGHGRIERRTYSLIQECELLERMQEFAGAKSIGRVDSHTQMGDGRIREDTRYFITSLTGDDALERLSKITLIHLGIENSCHYILDVTFYEDTCKTRDEICAQNLALARKLAMALSKRVPDEIVEKYSHNKAKYTSMKKRLFLANLYPDFMVEILWLAVDFSFRLL